MDKTLLLMSAFIFPKVSPNLALCLKAPFRQKPGNSHAFWDQWNTQQRLGHMSSQALRLTEVKAQWANPSEILCHVLFHFPFTPFLIFSFFFPSTHNPNICQAMLACPQRRVCICLASVKPAMINKPGHFYFLKLVCICILSLSDISHKTTTDRNGFIIQV